MRKLYSIGDYIVKGKAITDHVLRISELTN
jgi:hypothetical protein